MTLTCPECLRPLRLDRRGCACGWDGFTVSAYRGGTLSSPLRALAGAVLRLGGSTFVARPLLDDVEELVVVSTAEGAEIRASGRVPSFAPPAGCDQSAQLAGWLLPCFGQKGHHGLHVCYSRPSVLGPPVAHVWPLGPGWRTSLPHATEAPTPPATGGT